MITVYHGDNLKILESLPDRFVDLVYIDPPFNTGKKMKRTQIETVRDKKGDRTGFNGKRYKTIEIGSMDYPDIFDDYLTFLEPRVRQLYRILKPNGSFFFHIDYREVHYCKIMLDQIFGRSSFINEIIWAYDYGARSKTKWPTKHDNILWYAVDPKDYQFHLDQSDRIPYMAPDLVGKEKAARGKTPTDTWWHTIVPTNGKEKTGYPTQKPRGIIDRIIKVHSMPGNLVCDAFAGSGTIGESAEILGRNSILIDSNPSAIKTMKKRFAGKKVLWKTRT